MKILISTLSFTKLNPLKTLELISDNGFRYIETSPKFLGFNSENSKIIEQIENFIKKSNIKIISLNSLFFEKKNKI